MNQHLGLGETPTDLELTLQPTHSQPISTTNGETRVLPLNLVCRIASLAHQTEHAAAPQYQLQGNETAETVRLPETNALRLIEVFRRIYDPLEVCQWDSQWIFRYIYRQELSPQTPVAAQRRRQIIDLKGPANFPLAPSTPHSISRGRRLPVFETILTLDDPERSLMVYRRSLSVANTRDLAKLGYHLTSTCIPERTKKRVRTK